MRSVVALPLLASLILAGPATAQGSTSDGPCNGPKGPSIQRLQALARQYHPDALTPAKSRASVVVGFVLDTQCHVLHHTTGRRSAERIDVEATLASLFPGVRTRPFVVAGIADADADHAPARPWIVWTVVKS